MRGRPEVALVVIPIEQCVLVRDGSAMHLEMEQGVAFGVSGSGRRLCLIMDETVDHKKSTYCSDQ